MSAKKYQERNFKPFYFYHLYNQGFKQQVIFHDEEDLLKMVRIFKIVFQKYEAQVLAFCVMNNHYHLFMRNFQQNYSKLLGSIHARYSRYYRKKYSYKGKIWSKYFQFREVHHRDRKSILTEIRYIHQNPVKAGLVQKMNDYKYSSARLYQRWPHIKTPQFLFNAYTFDLFPGTKNEQHAQLMQWIMADAELQQHKSYTTKKKKVAHKNNFLQ